MNQTNFTEQTMNRSRKYRTSHSQSLQSHRQQGFTLIEILVVMAILGMLAVMVAPNLFRQQASARRDAALSQISSLETALDSYRLEPVPGQPGGVDGK